MSGSPYKALRPWLLWLAVAALALGGLAWQALHAPGGVTDPTSTSLSHGAVVLDSAVLVFREGLEAILVLAAITASLVGANGAYRRPVAGGGALAIAASVGTWFLAIAVVG